MTSALLLIQIIAYVIAILLLRSTKVNPVVIFLLIAVNLCLWIYTFRFQRTTLSIARMMQLEDIKSQANIQMLLTPNFLNVLVWGNTLLSAVAFALIGSNFNWVFATLYIVAKLIGVSFIDLFTPIPSYNHCFNIIESNLRNQIKSNKSSEIKAMSLRLLPELDEARKIHKEGKFKA